MVSVAPMKLTTSLLNTLPIIIANMPNATESTTDDIAIILALKIIFLPKNREMLLAAPIPIQKPSAWIIATNGKLTPMAAVAASPRCETNHVSAVL